MMTKGILAQTIGVGLKNSIPEMSRIHRSAGFNASRPFRQGGKESVG
jgi:hypothetical protein